MDIIKKIESEIKYDYRLDSEYQIESQINSFQKFNNLTENEIEYLLSHGHKSREVGLILEYLGHERLEKYLDQILSFLMDMNWPAARSASNLVLKSKEKILPEIKKAFLNNDEMWHYWMLSSIISRWPIELIKEIKPELIYLVEKDIYYLNDRQDHILYCHVNAIRCLLILNEYKLISKKILNEYYLELEKYHLSNNESYIEEMEQLRIACN